MMRIFNNFKVLMAAVGILGMAVQAQAATITISPSTHACGVADPVCLATTGAIEGSSNSEDVALQDVAEFLGWGLPWDNVGAFNTAFLGYKATPGGAEEGPGAPYYSTTFSNGNSDALITWDGPLLFQTGPLYVFVKDGNASPYWYLFRLAVGGAEGWDGKDDLDLQGFWEGTGKDGKGGISHVSIYGTAGPTVEEQCTNCETVPDGGSATMLLGMGLLGLAALRRRLGRI